jgi:choline dehydrogenase
MKPGLQTVSDADLIADARQRAYSIFHPVSSCRMGPDPKQAVVDHRLRMHGIAGLRIVDASVFPTVTSGNTNAPSIMVGERGAQFLLEDAK